MYKRQIHDYLGSIVARVLPSDTPEPLALASWALVHGLAFLHLDGKLDSSDDATVEATVRNAVLATLIRR